MASVFFSQLSVMLSGLLPVHPFFHALGMVVLGCFLCGCASILFNHRLLHRSLVEGSSFEVILFSSRADPCVGLLWVPSLFQQERDDRGDGSEGSVPSIRF